MIAKKTAYKNQEMSVQLFCLGPEQGILIIVIEPRKRAEIGGFCGDFFGVCKP